VLAVVQTYKPNFVLPKPTVDDHSSRPDVTIRL